MESTIIKTLKGATMESLFDNSEIVHIKYFRALNLKSEDDFNPNSKYKYEIRVRHSETEDVNLLFEKAKKAANKN